MKFLCYEIEGLHYLPKMPYCHKIDVFAQIVLQTPVNHRTKGILIFFLSYKLQYTSTFQLFTRITRVLQQLKKCYSMYLSVRSESLLLCQNVITAEDNSPALIQVQKESEIYYGTSIYILTTHSQEPTLWQMLQIKITMSQTDE